MLDFILDGFKHLNDIPEGESYQLQCSGLNLSRPRTRLESDRIVVSMKLKNNGNAIPDHLKDFCDKEEQELLRVDPRTFTFEQRQVLKKWILYETHNQNFNYLFEIGKRGYVQSAKTFMDIMSPVVQAVSSHEFLQDYCRANYPKANPQRCAFVFTQAKAWEEFNQVLNSTHLDVLDPRNAYDPADIDINADEYVTAGGEIYSNFWHFKLYQENIKTDRLSAALKAQQAGEHKRATFLRAEGNNLYAEIMQPFIDGLEEYCDEHTESECAQRTADVQVVKDEEKARFEAEEAARKKLEATPPYFRFDPCKVVDTDCYRTFDEKRRDYLTDAEEKARMQDSDRQLLEEAARREAAKAAEAAAKAKEEEGKAKEGAAGGKFVPTKKATSDDPSQASGQEQATKEEL